MRVGRRNYRLRTRPRVVAWGGASAPKGGYSSLTLLKAALAAAGVH